MAQESKEEVGALLARFSFLVTYTPLPGEVELPVSDTAQYMIQPRASLDPKEEVKAVMTTADAEKVAILLPGTRFDTHGTRHGRGGGWYDRFLAKCPSSWTRIGFCFEDQFSAEPLLRQEWDQSVDYVVVAPRDRGNPVVYVTHARS